MIFVQSVIRRRKFFCMPFVIAKILSISRIFFFSSGGQGMFYSFTKYSIQIDAGLKENWKITIQQQEWKYLFRELIYIIWLNRNRVVFEGLASALNIVQHREVDQTENGGPLQTSTIVNLFVKLFLAYNIISIPFFGKKIISSTNPKFLPPPLLSSLAVAQYNYSRLKFILEKGGILPWNS